MMGTMEVGMMEVIGMTEVEVMKMEMGPNRDKGDSGDDGGGDNGDGRRWGWGMMQVELMELGTLERPGGGNLRPPRFLRVSRVALTGRVPAD